MEYRFFWADGQVDYTPAASALSYSDLMMRMKDRGQLGPDQLATSYAAGLFDTERGVSIESESNGPDEAELAFIMTQQLERFDPRPRAQLPPITAASVEDTEPTYNFGFLKEPHETLYPCAFEGDKMRPDAIRLIKSWILPDVVEGDPEWDDYITFSVYGSGASYNWDEEGDFDVQMWVDVDKYNAKAKEPLTADELVAEVRRHVQTFNFPSFAEVGLATEDCDGAMLIQFYPKPGKGTEEENLASKPYACYDMDADKWLAKPEPITPEFYGQMFLLVHSKAQDIANQAEDLIAQLDRNILNWQFWTQMAEKYDSPAYDEIADQSIMNAKLEQQGVQTLFEGVFGGRQQAYSPEGQGYRDERDIVQKMLEVWGTFQKLKHYARMPFPWDETEMPPVEAVYESPFGSEQHHPDPVIDPVSVPSLEEAYNGSCFGYINGYLVVGRHHHQEIMGKLIAEGWTWETLMNAPQAWGWYTLLRNYNEEHDKQYYAYLKFTSDAGTLTDVGGAVAAWEQVENISAVSTDSYQRDHAERGREYGHGIRGRKTVDKYVKNPDSLYVRGEIPEAPPFQAPDWYSYESLWAENLLPTAKIGSALFHGYPSFIYYEPYDAIYLGDDHSAIVDENPELYQMEPYNYLAGWVGKIEEREGWVYALTSADLFKEDLGNKELELAAQQALDRKFPGIINVKEYWDDALANKTALKLTGEWWNEWREKELPSQGCFGYIGGELLIGQKHHQQIMGALMNNGWDWSDLFAAPQAWGWFVVRTPERYDRSTGDYGYEWDKTKMELQFTSDAGIMDPEMVQGAGGAFSRLYNMPVSSSGTSSTRERDRISEDSYGSGLRGKQHADEYQEGGRLHQLTERVIGTIPKPPEKPEDEDPWAALMAMPDVEMMPQPNQEQQTQLPGASFPPPHATDPEIPPVGTFLQDKLNPEHVYQITKSDSDTVMIQGVSPVLTETNFSATMVPAKYKTNWMPSMKILESNPFVEDFTPGYKIKVGDWFESAVAIWMVKAVTPNTVTMESENTGVIQDFAMEYIQEVIANGSLKPYKAVIAKAASFQKFADWNDLMEKAQRLRQEQKVNVVNNAPDHVIGEVEGDSGLYTTEIWRDDPESQAITMWDCGCQWSDYSWGRTRQWKKYEGRPCSHTLALFWEAQTQPLTQDEPDGQAAGRPEPGGGMQDLVPLDGMVQPFDPSDLIAPFGRPQPSGPAEPLPVMQPQPGPEQLISPAPPVSQPTIPTKDQSPLAIPGAFSKVAADKGTYVDTWLYAPKDDKLYRGAWHSALLMQAYPGVSGDMQALQDNAPMGWVFEIDGIPYAITASVLFQSGPESDSALAKLREIWPDIQWTAETDDMGWEQSMKVPMSQPRKHIRVSAFDSGVIVRNNVPLYGEEPRDGTPHIIPQNSGGEVLWSDDNEAIVIFPLDSGELGPHLVKVHCRADEIYADPKGQPFTWLKHHSKTSGYDPDYVEISDLSEYLPPPTPTHDDQGRPVIYFPAMDFAVVGGNGHHHENLIDFLLDMGWEWHGFWDGSAEWGEISDHGIQVRRGYAPAWTYIVKELGYDPSLLHGNFYYHVPSENSQP